MFEKEAEELVKNLNDCHTKEMIRDAFKDGSEFGYKKCLEEATQKYNSIISDYDKRIAELKERNGELAGQKASLERWFGEAKEIIREYLEWADWKGSNCPSYASICKKAEAFLKESRE